MQEFQLRMVPTGNNDFALELYQCAYKRAGEKKRWRLNDWEIERDGFGVG